MGYVDVTVESLTRVMRAEGLEPHLMLRAAIGWLNPDETVEAEHRARAEFLQLGLMGPRGVSGDTLDWLVCLSRASVEYLAVVTEVEDGETSNILVAGAGRDAVMAYRVGQWVRLLRIPNENLAGKLLQELPHVAPARGSFNANIAELTPRQMLSDSIMQPVNSDSSARMQLRRITDDPAIRNVELYVGIRDGYGHYRVNKANPLRLRDGHQGRRLILREGDTLTVIPATPQLLLERLDRARRQLAGS